MGEFKLDDQGIVGPCKLCGQRNRVAYERMTEAATCGKCRKPLSPPDAPMPAEGKFTFLRLLANSPGPVLGAYVSPAGEECGRLKLELEALAAIDAGKILIVTIDAEALPDLAKAYDAAPQPVLILSAGGHEVSRSAGFSPSSEIRRWMVRTMAA